MEIERRRKGRHGYDEGGDIERAKMKRELGERREAIQFKTLEIRK